MESLTEEFRKLLDEYTHILPVKVRSLPEIDLYMDQLTTFMEDKLKNQRRYPEDKILTKTMINNYTKNHLLPPPVKKKYTQDHLITLLYTYYLKSVLSISDITTLLNPMTDHFWDNFRENTEENREEDLPPSMMEIYQSLFENISEISETFHQDLEREIDRASHSFTEENLTPEQREYLQMFTFVTMLGFDVYMKKRIMETLIDHMREE